MAKQNKGRKFFAASATAALVASAIVPVASAAQVNDYNKISGYAKEAVQSLVDAGVIQGDTNGNFNPLNTVTRAQAAEIFTKALELKADGDVNFKDVKKGAWYYNSIAAVVANGIFEGVSATEFAPNKSLTRSEAAKVLVDAFGLEGSESLSQFADASQVKPWAKSALETAVANGIFTGSEENGKLNLKPNAAITRQDFAVVFARTLDLVDTETPVDAAVKAINNTTVEVTFDEKVGNLDDLKFTIDGLEITNKAHKQSNDKVVVLTTAAQEVGKEYTVKLDGEEIGKFKGVEAVIPTAIDIVEKSQQNIVGNQVTVKAKVTVAEGKSKANIPVTFNIVNNNGLNTNNLNQPIVAEATTDENGVATYTYTRYAQTSNQIASSDEVQAYATGKPALRSFAKVYWASVQPLAITEVTTGNSINNGGKKVYKVAAALNHAESKTVGGVTKYYVNIGYLENINVTPDKAVKNVTVTDSKGANLGYPGQFTTSAAGNNASVKEVEIELDSKGEATFTLTGSNATVTPFVFVDQNTNPANAAGTLARFDETELFAKAPAVTFAKTQTLGLAVTAEGVQGAAAYATGSTPNVYDAENTGGRTYKATLTNLDGKTAQSGTPVYVSVKYGTAVNKNDELANVYLWDNNAKTVTKLSYSNGSPVPVRLLTDKNGQVSFKLIGDKDSYATPTVYTETGDKAGLDSNDLQQTAEIVYFGDSVVNSAKLLVGDKESTSVVVNSDAEFTYQTVDQNGNAYVSATDFVVSFEVSTTFNPAKVSLGQGSFVPGYGAKTVAQGSTETFAVNSTGKSKASIKVNAANGTQVSVKASASQGTFPILSASATFTNLNNEGIEAGQSLKGKVLAVDTDKNLILLTDSKGKNVYELTYAADELWVAGTGVTEATFEKELQPGEELHFTQKTDTTKAKFDNLNIDSGVNVAAGTNIILNTKGSNYDFGAKTVDANFEIGASNITLKNGTINGNITVSAANQDDFTLDNVILNGNLIVNGGDGNTVNVLKGSKVTKLLLNIKEHLVVSGGSTIGEVVVKADGSKVDVDGVGSTISLLTTDAAVKTAPVVTKTNGGAVTAEKTVDLSDTTAPTATAKYTATAGKDKVEAKPAVAATEKIQGIELTAKTAGAAGNNITVKFVADETATENKVTEEDGKVTVAFKTDATIEDVVNAINTSATTVSAKAPTDATVKVTAGEVKLANGADEVKGEEAVPASYNLTFTFSEAIANPTEVEFFVGSSTTAEKTVEWNTAKTVATVKLAETLPEATTTATVKKAADANGNVISTNAITITR